MSIPARARVVVTGGGSGLGRAFAKHFAGKNGQVLIADVDASGAEATKALVESMGAKAYTRVCDVAKPDEVESLAKYAEETMGGADVVINNAGVAVAGLIGEIPLKDWEWITGINLWGVVYGCHFFTPMMKRQGSGHFINVASLAAVAQAPGMGPYNVTKAAVVALTETLAAELKDHGIGATVLCPSFFKTNIMKNGRVTNMNQANGLAEKLMARSRIQADDVAAYAVKKAEKGEIYALPHPEGRLTWGIKRLAPGLFHGNLVPRAAKRTLA